MAPPFIFSPNLETEPESDCLSVQTLTDISSFRPSSLEEFVKSVSFDLSDKELFCVQEQDLFDRVYSLVKHFSSLSPSCKFNLVESLRSNFSVLLPSVDSLSRASQSQHDDQIPVVDRIASHRNAFKIYTYFLIQVVLAEEANVSSNQSTKVVAGTRKKQLINSWNWESQRSRILNLIANSLEINLSLLFGSSDPDENYLSFIMKNSFSMFENATMLKDADMNDALCRIIGTCATKYHYTAHSCASILHLIYRHDFVVSHLANAVAIAEKKYADGSMATYLIREIGRTNPKEYVRDAVGAENIGRFLVELSDRLPKLISTNIGLLVPHFGGESYKIRNALVGVLAKLVTKAFSDVEGEGNSKSIRLRTKQAMLEILLERCRDVSAYTRSRVLQVWAELCEEHAVSIGLWNEIAAVAAGRLEDKSAIVRKSALNLLIMMLQHNPFGPQLRSASFEATLEQYKRKLKELAPDSPSESVLDGLPLDNDASNEDGEVDDPGAEARPKEQQDSLTDSCLPEVDDEIVQENAVPDVGNMEQTRTLIASLEAGLCFSKSVSATMSTLVQLMASSSASDVENTILLLIRCKQFQIDGAESCLRKMLPLVFSQEKSIYEAVENAFITIYLRKSPVETAKNLMNLAIDSNIGDLAALEFIVAALVSKGDISSSMLSSLWDFFCFNISGTTAEQSRGALFVLCMAAKSSPGVLGSHLQDIVDIGFGRWAKLDPLLARTACIALQRLSEDDQKKLLSKSGSRLFGILESLITGPGLPENIWYAAADKAITTIYTIHPTPETFAANLVKKVVRSVFDFNGRDDLETVTSTEYTDVLSTLEVTKLSRFLYIVSHIAMSQLVYIESCVRKIQKEKAKKERLVAEGKSVDCNGMTPPDAEKENGINAELGLACTDDAVLDTLSASAEKEIVSAGSVEKNLIGPCGPFLSKLCRNITLMQKYPDLQASGMLALCRLMIIDTDFCDANLQLLFTVVESAPSETVRSNCTIALGDLAVRFPNLLEPWTEHMYARLSDTSVAVRKNAVLVLSHLILNDMMKVKGHIYEMAIRLEDEDERISNLAKLFFHELSKKGSNPIYNLLPDILGKLSNKNLERDTFCNIMQFLIGSIKKDKQMEALVEKLCNRFSGVTDTKQWEYISYCLSQLSFTDKGMKKLIELFKTYEHVLCEDLVMDHFKNIINKGKKFAKPDLKACIEEFEEKINKFHIEKKEQEVTAKNAELYQQKLRSLENTEVAVKDGAESTESKTSEDGTDSEVTNEVITTSLPQEKIPESEDKSPASSELIEPESSLPQEKIPESEDISPASSELIEPESSDNEVQLAQVFSTGVLKSRAKKTNIKDEKCDSKLPTRITRSRRRNV